MNLISKGIFLLSFLFETFATSGQDCKKLTDGKFRFKYKTKGYEKSAFTFVLKGDNYTIVEYDKTESTGKLEWISSCLFKLHPDPSQASLRADTLNNVEKFAFSLGDVCYELTERRKFRVIYCGNLNVKTSEGRIERVRGR